MTNNKYSVKDFIAIGVFSVLMLLCAMITGGPLASIPTLTFYFPIGAAVLAGPVFMLFIAKVPKKGSLIIMGAIMCILGTVTGMHWGMNFGILLTATIASFVASIGNFKNMKLNVLSYILYSFGPMGTYFVFFFDKEGWVEYMLKKGTEQEYIDIMSNMATPTTIIIMVAGTVVVALLSGLLGVKLMKKQFIKAGLTDV